MLCWGEKEEEEDRGCGEGRWEKREVGEDKREEYEV